jgi:hypothetical protein
MQVIKLVLLPEVLQYIKEYQTAVDTPSYRLNQIILDCIKRDKQDIQQQQ